MKTAWRWREPPCFPIAGSPPLRRGPHDAPAVRHRELPMAIDTAPGADPVRVVNPWAECSRRLTWPAATASRHRAARLALLPGHAQRRRHPAAAAVRPQATPGAPAAGRAGRFPLPPAPDPPTAACAMRLATATTPPPPRDA